MRTRNKTRQGAMALGIVSGLVGGLLLAGCAGSSGAGGALQYLWTPFIGTSGTSGGTTPGSTGVIPGTGTNSSGAAILPCSESQSRKFIRIAMRNTSQDYIHYFVVLIAFVFDPANPQSGGAVCQTDIPLYTAFGYVLIPSGSQIEFGDYCIVGPALYYFHKNGQFQGAGSSGLASAIAPAQGTTATYDTFFTSAGAQVPVPNLILFHNPGSTPEGIALKVSRNTPSPCSSTVQTAGDPFCLQDAFYYVDVNDVPDGTTALGTGSSRRVPAEIQASGCSCAGSTQAFSILAASNLKAKDSAVVCNNFFRGGRIDFVFVRDDTTPPYPQLLWRVTDDSGTQAQNFDPRAQLP